MTFFPVLQAEDEIVVDPVIRQPLQQFDDACRGYTPVKGANNGIPVQLESDVQACLGNTGNSGKFNRVVIRNLRVQHYGKRGIRRDYRRGSPAFFGRRFRTGLRGRIRRAAR